MINGVILQKLQTLDEILTELRSLGQLEPAQLQADWRTLRDFEQFRDEVLAYVQR
jgi:hypothetical protein